MPDTRDEALYTIDQVDKALHWVQHLASPAGDDARALIDFVIRGTRLALQHPGVSTEEILACAYDEQPAFAGVLSTMLSVESPPTTTEGSRVCNT